MLEHSLFFYLLLLLLTAGVGQGLIIGVLFFARRFGIRQANFFFGLLLITFSLTLLHNTLTIANFFAAYPAWKFLPIYFTLSFPTLLFYHVKLELYPSYRLRATDIKHFILPAGQFLFFVFMFLTAVEFKRNFDRHFFNPFYGATEHLLYLTSFFAYLYFGYRYVRQKRKTVRDRVEAKKVLYLKTLLQFLFILFCIHAVFVVSDFVIYEIFGINLRTVKSYAAFGVLSFAALVYWLGIYGAQVLVWGRKVFRR